MLFSEISVIVSLIHMTGFQTILMQILQIPARGPSQLEAVSPASYSCCSVALHLLPGNHIQAGKASGNAVWVLSSHSHQCYGVFSIFHNKENISQFNIKLSLIGGKYVFMS